MRFRKSVSTILIAASAFMMADCYSTRIVGPAKLEPKKKSFRILDVWMNGGETLSFEKKTRARIVGGEILVGGVPPDSRIPLSEVASVRIREFDGLRTVLAVMGGAVLIVGGSLIWLSTFAQSLVRAFPKGWERR